MRCTESRLPLCWGSCEHLPPLHYPHTHFHTHTHTHTHIFTHTHYRFRQEEPEDLVAMQIREWDPVVNWFNHRYNIPTLTHTILQPGVNILCQWRLKI